MGSSQDLKIIDAWKKHREDLNINYKQLSKINTETILEYHFAVFTKNIYVANRMVGVVGKLFNYAKVKGYYSSDNPASKLKKNRNKKIKDHHDYYSMTIMNRLIATALKLSKHHNKRTGYYAIFASLFCGGRPQSKVFSLTADQIDLKNMLIHL